MAMKTKPSAVHRQTLHEVGNWSRDEMGLKSTYQQYRDGKISAGQYIHHHAYVKSVLVKAKAQHRANPHLNMSLVAHARSIHADLEAKKAAKVERDKKKAVS